MSFFSFPCLKFIKDECSLQLSLTYYFPRYLRGNIHSKESNFCSPNAVFFLCPHKSVAMYVRYREYITLLSLENVPFAAGENENSPNTHENFHGNMVLFLKNITK